MPIIAVDTETKGLDCTAFVLGVAIEEGREPRVFNNRERMAEWLINTIEKEKRRGHKTWIYGHMMEYDFYTIFQGQFDKFEYMSFNPFIVKYKESGNFLDSADIFKMPLWKLGETIRLPKLDAPSGLKDGKKLGSIFDIKRYCQRDTEIVLKGITGLRDRLDLAGLRPRRIMTAGQVAMSAYVTWAKKKGIWDRISYYNYERKKKMIYPTGFEHNVRVAYRGGNNTAFQTGRFRNVACADTNSLYPHIMSTMDMPDITNETTWENMSIHRILNEEGFTHCTAEVPKIRIGYLPIRHEKRLMFPNKKGLEMESIWTNLELRKAIKLGYAIKEIKWQISYPLTGNIFREYMEMMYRMKQEPENREIAKILMNSLYGKFGQRTERKKIEFTERKNILEMTRKGWQIEGELGEKYAISKMLDNTQRSYFVNPVIPAMITAGARDFLYKHMAQVGKRDLIYCDTDSVIMRNPEKYREHVFRIGTDMGEWKMAFEHENIDIRGEKKYATESGIVKLAGAKAGARTLKTFEDSEYTQDEMTGLKDAIKGMGLPGMFTETRKEVRTAKKGDIEIKGERIVDT